MPVTSSVGRGMIDYDALEARGYCECGRTLRRHPPLSRPRPLRSWMAARHETHPNAVRVPPNLQQMLTHQRFMRLRGDR